jgi:hypothetical protein
VAVLSGPLLAAGDVLSFLRSLLGSDGDGAAPPRSGVLMFGVGPGRLGPG